MTKITENIKMETNRCLRVENAFEIECWTGQLRSAKVGEGDVTDAIRSSDWALSDRTATVSSSRKYFHRIRDKILSQFHREMSLKSEYTTRVKHGRLSTKFDLQAADEKTRDTAKRRRKMGIDGSRANERSWWTRRCRLPG